LFETVAWFIDEELGFNGTVGRSATFCGDTRAFTASCAAFPLHVHFDRGSGRSARQARSALTKGLWSDLQPTSLLQSGIDSLNYYNTMHTYLRDSSSCLFCQLFPESIASVVFKAGKVDSFISSQPSIRCALQSNRSIALVVFVNYIARMNPGISN
jgi:hypothetical protein